ncbi:MAG: SUMF1/EgtB/PvdO family nonheme iron enzyme [Spirochaetales bacterium]|nr:SUMF1/EgtB/PvdO family nonheme iron enzyme [Spirochaetales bacterium]
MGKYEVTFDAWERVKTWAEVNSYYTINSTGVMGNGSGGNDTSNEPVTTITWRDAIVWCNAASEYDG